MKIHALAQMQVPLSHFPKVTFLYQFFTRCEFAKCKICGSTKLLQNLSSAAVVNGDLRVKKLKCERNVY